MNLKLAKFIRKAAEYRPREGTEYEAPALHTIARMPLFETRTHVIRELGPVVPGKLPNPGRDGARRYVVERTITNIVYSNDGKTPKTPLWTTMKDEHGVVHQVPQTEFIPVAKPARLKKGSPKALYRFLKRLERTVGLEAMYDQLYRESHGAAVGA